MNPLNEMTPIPAAPEPPAATPEPKIGDAAPPLPEKPETTPEARAAFEVALTRKVSNRTTEPGEKPDGEITISYLAVDGAHEKRSFKRFSAAQRYAHKMVGAHPELGRSYAVSGDGVGKVSVAGAKLRDIFPDEPAAEPAAKSKAKDKPAAGKTKAAKPAGEKPPTVKERIWALIDRPEGVSEPEVCKALNWQRAGATIGRAVKAAPWPVKKERGEDGRLRYYRATGKARSGK